MSQSNRPPKKTLADLKNQLQQAKPLTVGPDGQLQIGDETQPSIVPPDSADLPKPSGTVVKPSRWFAR